jgi:hypothetical protein
MPSYMATEFLTTWMLCSYYTLLLFPMVSIGLLPKLTEKLKKILQFRRQRLVVGPARMIGNLAVVQ